MATTTFNRPVGARQPVARTSSVARSVAAQNAMPRAATEVERMGRAGPQEDAQTAATTASPDLTFAPLDPNIVSATIPAFFIGRNMQGFWVARERNGAIGGIFLLESSALSFARSQGGEAGCATIFPARRFELDVRNDGNPLVNFVAPLMRKVAQLCQRIGKAL
ncbi:hypothetical protein [Bradyrhizobium sp. Tv2a-2]|uniref:hypothetical protein n=1 Tax=Bradyrhizobium sp. Tv2a-2 TaxID=113395 RepID=UPI000402C2D6|nr:hypothetical protein [Bradyrhizobium sp. Tv2a-2]